MNQTGLNINCLFFIGYEKLIKCPLTKLYMWTVTENMVPRKPAQEDQLGNNPLPQSDNNLTW